MVKEGLEQLYWSKGQAYLCDITTVKLQTNVANQAGRGAYIRDADFVIFDHTGPN
jgi:hypothetical protein